MLAVNRTDSHVTLELGRTRPQLILRPGLAVAVVSALAGYWLLGGTILDDMSLRLPVALGGFLLLALLLLMEAGRTFFLTLTVDMKHDLVDIVRHRVRGEDGRRLHADDIQELALKPMGASLSHLGLEVAEAVRMEYALLLRLRSGQILRLMTPREWGPYWAPEEAAALKAFVAEANAAIEAARWHSRRRSSLSASARPRRT